MVVQKSPVENPLKIVLRRCGLSQHYVAYTLSISQSQLNQWLLGYKPMPTTIENKIKSLIAMGGQKNKNLQNKKRDTK